MRACWLKWVGRDWSISADYIWLNYSGANRPSVQSEIEDQASGSTKQKELAQETVRNYLIPVPPLAEQRRIVYEVDWLFKILV